MSKIFKALAVILMGIGFGLSASAQTVTGVVTDSSGEPVIGAFVVVQGTTNGVSTGLDGDYSINVEDASTAVFEVSMIGLKTVVVAVNGRSVVDVVLEDDTTMLDETVVVGYATVKRRDLLGSVSSVNSDKLTEQPVSNVSQALSGKMAGVSVTTTEGDPDADIKIRVRGGGSITQDNSPLYIVDGFPVESISDIASSEIASIDVLKDAFSTAIYGSRGANGVVIVTTKSAEKGQKISVKLNAYAGMKKMANPGAIKAMDAENYVKFQYELAQVRNKVADEYEPYFGSFSDIDLYTGLATNDWVDMVFGNTGSNYNADFTISGSSENVNWTLGYAHTGDNAIMTASTYSRDNLSFKSNFKTSKTTNIDLNVRYSRTNVLGGGSNSMSDTGTTSGNGRLKHAVCYAPIPVSSTLQNIDEEEDYGDNAPPLRSVADNDSKRVRNTWTANAAFNWNIINGLSLKIDGGIEDYRQTDNRFYGLTTYYAANSANNTPSNHYKDLTRNKLRNTNTLNYSFDDVINNMDHSLSVLVGEEMTFTKSNTLTSIVQNFPLFYDSQMAWNFMSSGSAISTSNYISPNDVLLSFFGRVNYDFKHKYSFGATFRADGSSKFAKQNRWGYFPSAAASWTISNEPWMSGKKNIDQIKLRYSFGTAGNNNIPSGQINREFQADSNFPTWVHGTGSYWTSGKTMNNPNLKWETTITHNIGLDFSFFQSKISGSIEVYQNDTKDLLILFPIAGTGYDNQYKNVGSTRNRGAELSLNMPLITKKDYSLSISGNIAYNRNKITDLGGLEAITGSSVQSYWASTEIGDDYRVEVGQPLGNMYGYICDGRYAASDFTYSNGKWVLNEGVADDSAIIGAAYLMPGALKLKADEDGVIRKHVIGNASPDFNGGFALNAFVKGFDLSANFTYMIGNDVYNANKIEFTSSRKFKNRNLIDMMNVENRWTNIDWTTGQLVTDIETLDAMNANTTMWSPCINNAVFTDWAVEDASYLRLQSLTLGYTLPETFTEKIHIRKLRVYVTGTNLFCLTGYSGYDPEVDTRRSTPLTPGVDYSAYPKSRGFVAGINLTF
ncbi:MAG: TonB-dependent receptor [Bacteroidales bacterium]|nr:TonB-dependent receptor [Bacteroidales bacterium]